MKILSVDVGDARTGLAVCDRGELLASPVGVIHEFHKERLADRVADQAREQGAEMIVVGHPINMDGTLGPRSALVKEFCSLLSARCGVPVRLWDERGTTVSATRILNETDVRGKKRKAVVDAVAAVIILESCLAYRKNHPVGESK